MPPEEGLFELDRARTSTWSSPSSTRAIRASTREGIDRTLLGRDSIRLALPPGRRGDGPRGAARPPWVMEPDGTAARQWATQQCRAAGFEPEVRYEATDLIAHVRLVAAGHAVGMLPDLVWSGEREGVRLVDLPGAPSREIFAATRASSRDSEAIGAVRAALADALADHAPH